MGDRQTPRTLYRSDTDHFVILTEKRKNHDREAEEALAMQLSKHIEAEDFVIATGEQHSVREFVELAFKYFGVTIEWQGAGSEDSAERPCSVAGRSPDSRRRTEDRLYS